MVLLADTIENESNEIYFEAIMRTNQTNEMEFSGQRLNTSVFGRSADMNIKLIRNAMFITVIILAISVLGKTSAHEARSMPIIFHSSHAPQIILVR